MKISFHLTDSYFHFRETKKIPAPSHEHNLAEALPSHLDDVGLPEGLELVALPLEGGTVLLQLGARALDVLHPGGLVGARCVQDQSLLL